MAAVPARDPGNAGWLGLPALREFLTIVDYPSGRLILERRRVPDNRPDFTTTGLVLRPPRDNRPALVADVMAGSPAGEAGLLPATRCSPSTVWT